MHVISTAVDWDGNYITYRLRKAGTSFRKLSSENNMHPDSLKKVVRVEWPRAERIIATTLGVSVADIWPTRVEKRVKRKIRA